VLEKVQWGLDGMKRKIKMMACRFYLGMSYCVPFPLRMFYYFEVTQLAMQEYIPSLYPGRLVFLQAEKSSLAWSEMAAEGLEFHEVPGGHLELLRDPHAQVVGEKLRACLESAAQCPLELSKPTNRDEDRF
jgi:aspartate racemase